MQPRFFQRVRQSTTSKLKNLPRTPQKSLKSQSVSTLSQGRVRFKPHLGRAVLGGTDMTVFQIAHDQVIFSVGRVNIRKSSDCDAEGLSVAKNVDGSAPKRPSASQLQDRVKSMRSEMGFGLRLYCLAQEKGAVL